MEEYGAADYFLQAFCWNNPASQSELLATLQVGQPEPSFGTDLLNGLGTCMEGSHAGSRAARVVRCLLEGNPDGKIAALGFVVRVPSDDRQEYFLNWWGSILVCACCVSAVKHRIGSTSSQLHFFPWDLTKSILTDAVSDCWSGAWSC